VRVAQTESRITSHTTMKSVVLVLLLAAPLPATGASARLEAVRKTIAARTLAAEGLPDPKCKTGVVSLPSLKGAPQICCAGYCGECSDYPTCGSVRGQDSKNACCMSSVAEMACGKAPANVCIKKCTESVPPCIMEATNYKPPDKKQRTAGTNCTEAVADWRAKAESAIAAGALKEKGKKKKEKANDNEKKKEKEKEMEKKSPSSRACSCIPCGSTTPRKYKSGACGPQSDTCGPGTGSSGCYSSVSATCDCGTELVDESFCSCIPCGSTTPRDYGSGTCGPRSDTCGPGTGSSGCYSSASAACDCGKKKVKP